MSVEMTIENVEPRLIAAVRREVRIGEVGAAWGPALDIVWRFLRGHAGLHAGGHNVFLYEHPTSRDAPMTVHFGVEVTRAFEPDGEVHAVTTPRGQAAVATHVGPYDRMRVTHDAIHAWAAANARSFAGTSWEIYGDGSDDPSKLVTTIGYLLER